jgi:hypothetical protein
MAEYQFVNLSIMLEEIKKHTKENFTYVTAFDNLIKRKIGWYCEKTNTYFYMNETTFKVIKSNSIRYLDTPTKRKIASVYLSNCATESEYNNFRTRVNKLKAFW